jgi:hypothetical protein
MICAERYVPAGFHVHDIKVEFRRDPRFGRYATRDELPDGSAFKPDAVLTIAHMSEVVAQLVEIDMGTETIVSAPRE